jgi:transcriptional regulator with XRE-family HTH domain
MSAELFAERLRQLRQAAGLTIQALADRAGMHREGVAQLERNKRRPGWESVCALADALGVSTETFRGKQAAEVKASKTTEKTLTFKGKPLKLDPANIELMAKYLLPLVKQLIRQARVNRVLLDQTSLCSLAGQIEILFLGQKEGYEPLDERILKSQTRPIPCGHCGRVD